MRGALWKCIRAASRGSSPRDKLLIALVLLVLTPSRGLLRKRPRALRLLSDATNRDVCLKTKTPRGPARVIFNPSQDCELIVVRELLVHQIYLVKSGHDAVIDIGAFRGISTIYLADQVASGCIIAIEPNSENFAILVRRLRKHIPDARVIEAAVGQKSGMGKFAGMGVSGRTSIHEGHCIEVLAFDELLRSAPCDDPIIKIDIEGDEEALFPGIETRLPHRCLIFLETHAGITKAKALLEPLRVAGFAIERCGAGKSSHENDTYIDWELRRKKLNCVSLDNTKRHV
jgi:FkbM family methyltransferase